MSEIMTLIGGFVFGIIMGMIVQRMSFCGATDLAEMFTGNYRRIFTWLAIIFIVTGLGFQLLGPSTIGEVRGYGIYNLLGGMSFGIGMMIAGGCIIGTLRRIGEGFIHAIFILAGWIIGSAITLFAIDPLLKHTYYSSRPFFFELLGMNNLLVYGVFAFLLGFLALWVNMKNPPLLGNEKFKKLPFILLALVLMLCMLVGIYKLLQIPKGPWSVKELTKEDWKLMEMQLQEYIQKKDVPGIIHQAMHMEILNPDYDFVLPDPMYDALAKKLEMLRQKGDWAMFSKLAFVMKYLNPDREPPVTEEDWKHMWELLEKYEKEGKWDKLSCQAQFMKIIRPNLPPEEDEKLWNAIVKTLEELRKKKDWWEFSLYASHARYVYPDRKLPITKEDWKGMFEELDKYRKEGDWWRFSRQAAKMKVIDPNIDLKLTGEDWHYMRELLYQFKREGKYYEFTWQAMNMHIIVGKKFGFYVEKGGLFRVWE